MMAFLYLTLADPMDMGFSLYNKPRGAENTTMLTPRIKVTSVLCI